MDLDKIPGAVKAPSKLHIAIVAPPNGGKTYFLERWPNILVLDCEGKLSADTPRVPVNDQAFIRKYAKPWCDKPENWRGARPAEDSHIALLEWVYQVGPTLPADITLALDCFTHLNHALTAWVESNHGYFKSKANNFDSYAGWNYRLTYWHKLFTAFKKLACNVISTYHEEEETDNMGKKTGKISPMCGGKFKDQIASYWNLALRILNNSTSAKKDYRFQLSVTPAWTPRLQEDVINWEALKTNIDSKTGTIPASYEELVKIINPERI